MHDAAPTPGTVTLNITNNGQDFSQQSLMFTFLALCPAGHYCVGPDIIPCKSGTFCQGEGNFNETLCPPGTYQRSAHRPTVGRVRGAPSVLSLAPSRQDMPAGRVVKLR